MLVVPSVVWSKCKVDELVPPNTIIPPLVFIVPVVLVISPFIVRVFEPISSVLLPKFKFPVSEMSLLKAVVPVGNVKLFNEVGMV